MSFFLYLKGKHSAAARKVLGALKLVCNCKVSNSCAGSAPERSLDTVVRAVSAAVLPVWVDFTSLKGLPCAPGPATTRRGMLVTNG